MTEMVERVAKALCAHPFDLYDKIKGDPNEAKDQLLLQEQMERWRAMARAAIEAMRDPTEKMAEAGSITDEKIDVEGIERHEEAACKIWQTMIDAALNA